MVLVVEVLVLTLALLMAMVIGNAENTKKIAQQLTDLLSRFQAKNPDEEEAKRKAEEAIKKAQKVETKPTPEPEPDPKTPPNTPPPIPFVDNKKKDKDKCAEILEKLGVRPYGTTKVPDKELHHIVQNAYFQHGEPPKSIDSICPGYSQKAALAIPLDKGTGNAHDRINKMQKDIGVAVRKDFRDSNGTLRPQYWEAKEQARYQLRTIPLTPEEEECVLKAADAAIHAMCPDITDSTKLRILGTRDLGP